MKGFLIFVVVSVVVVLGVAFTFGNVVPPGKMGVRQLSFGPKSGFSDRGLEPGYHWSIPTYSKIHLIPRTLQTLSMNRDGKGAFSSLEIQTTDGSSVEVDITVLYRFELEAQTGEGAHGGPADLITKLGYEPEHWVDYIHTVTSDELRRTLGRLSTSDFYDPEKREVEIEKGQSEISSRLDPLGISVQAVLLRRYTYTPKIDDAIFQKTLQDQEARLSEAQRGFAAANAVIEKAIGDLDSEIQTLRVSQEGKARTLRSAGDAYEKQRNSEGDLLIAKAKAEVNRLRASALADSGGADIYVAMQLAPLLGTLRGGIVNDFDPYDLNGWVSKLGISKGK